MPLCIYCGSIAEGRDHLKPRKYDSTGRLAFGSLVYDTTHIKTVPSCNDCNRKLVGCQETDIRERAKFLALKCETLDIDPERLKWMKSTAFMEN